MTDAPALSLSKDKIRVLMLEGVNDSAVARFSQIGYSNLERLPKALDGQALLEAVKGVHILGIRSRTKLSRQVLEAADRLIAVGCFSVGTNQVDLDAAESLGVPVFNAPVLQHPQRRRAGHRRDRHVAPAHTTALGLGASRRLGQVGRQQPRGARQDARHRRLRQYRLAALLSRRGDGHAGDLPRPHRQAAPRQHRAERIVARPAGAERRRVPACAGDAGDLSHDRRGGDFRR